MQQVEYSIVIPAYNSGNSLEELSTRLVDVFKNEIARSFEIIIVDDCSPDYSTWKVAAELARQFNEVRAFRLARNFGQGRAVLCGMAQSRGKWIITMDDDLQHRPEDIPKLIEKADHDVVIARFPVKRASAFKSITSKGKGFLDRKLLGLPDGIESTSFKLIKRRVVDEMLSITTPRPFIIAMILASTNDLVNVDVEHQERKYGKSNYSLRRSFSLISNQLINNSSFLLRLMSFIGFLTAGASFLFGFILVLRKLIFNDVVPGWTSVVVLIFMATGIIVFCLGVVGEYLWRLIEASENKPKFSIRDSVDI